MFQMPEKFNQMGRFFVLERLKEITAIALAIAPMSHPGARAQMQYHAVTKLQVFAMIYIEAIVFHNN